VPAAVLLAAVLELLLEPPADAEAAAEELEFDDELPQPATASSAASIVTRTSTFLSLGMVPLSPILDLGAAPAYWSSNTVQHAVMYPKKEHHVKWQSGTQICWSSPSPMRTAGYACSLCEALDP